MTMGHNPDCAGCQICFEYLLEARYGPEWWDHPDCQPRPDEFDGEPPR